MDSPTIAAITFGCKINQYETSCMLDEFVRHGYKVVDFKQTADVYLINSCTVTNRTDHKSRNALRKALKQKKLNSKTKVVITGCYSQRNREEILELGKVDLIIDNNEKSKIYDLLENRQDTKTLDPNIFDELSTTQMFDHTRAFLKIQDGCDHFCAYCAIPFARGRSRSRDRDKIFEQISLLVKNGYREFVLGGINLGLYGRDKEDNYFLSDLLCDIEQIEGVELIRLSSIEPELFTDGLYRFFAESKKITHHFHIPLQVGSNKLLKKMKRRYSTSDFQDTLARLYKIFPDAAIGIDVITGLPGETEQLFQETYLFLETLEFCYLHVFTYSHRSGTEAAKMKNRVNGRIKKERTSKLLELSRQKTAGYRQKLINKGIQLCGVAEKREKGLWTALSDHYIRIYFDSKKPLQGQMLQGIPNKQKFDGLLIE